MKRLVIIALLSSPLFLKADRLAELNDSEDINFDNLGTIDREFQSLPPYQRYFKKGYKALTTKNIDMAIDYFLKSLADNDAAPQTYFNLGICYEGKGRTNDAIEAYKDAILLKLDYSKAHLQLAKLLHQKGEQDQAIIHYEQAVRLDTQLTEPSLTLAHLLVDQERFEESLPYFKRFVDRNPNSVSITFEYANALNTSHHSIEALELYQQLLEKRPNETGILHNTAYTLKKLGRLDEAMIFYERALAIKPDHSETHFSLGLAYLAKGDFKKGWQEYEWRWQRGSQLSPREFKQPQWDGITPLDGKLVFLHAEQGLGDTFQFIRLAKELKKRYPTVRLIVAVQSPLKTVITRCCPYIDFVITLNQIPVNFDFHSPLMTLPLLLNIEEHTVPAEIPYIFPDPQLIHQWKEKLASDSNFKVGICWQGNSKYSTPFLRATVAAKSLPMKKFAALGTIPHVSFYCLQKETGTDQLKSIPINFNLKTFGEDFDNDHGRFMDSAAVIKNLDLVITVDTSISHFAAAIGTPTWVLLPEPADWRWMIQRADTPWYPNMRLFRQPTQGDWDSVLNNIAEELTCLLQSKGLYIAEEKSEDSYSPAYPFTDTVDTPEKKACEESLKKQLAYIDQQFKKKAAQLATGAVSLKNEKGMNIVRALYFLSELHNDIVHKIAAVRG